MSDEIQNGQTPEDAVDESQLDQVAGGRGGITIKMCPECNHIMMRRSQTKTSDSGIVSIQTCTYYCTNPSCGHEETTFAYEEDIHRSEDLF